MNKNGFFKNLFSLCNYNKRDKQIKDIIQKILSDDNVEISYSRDKYIIKIEGLLVFFSDRFVKICKTKDDVISTYGVSDTAFLEYKKMVFEKINERYEMDFNKLLEMEDRILDDISKEIKI